MTQLTEQAFTQLHHVSMRSRDSLKHANELGCYNCIHQFAYDDINYFIDDDRTALCPRCRLDTVVPVAHLPIDQRLDVLRQLQKRYPHPANRVMMNTKAELVHVTFFHENGDFAGSGTAQTTHHPSTSAFLKDILDTQNAIADGLAKHCHAHIQNATTDPTIIINQLYNIGRFDI